MNQLVPDLSQSLAGFGPWKLILKLLLSPAQRRLIQLAKKEPWRAKLMEELYLTNRRSLTFHSNVVYLFEHDPRYQDPISRAALISTAAYEFYQNNAQQSDYQYLFSTTRVPGEQIDSRHHSKNQNHLIVSISGNCYQVILDNPVDFRKLKNTFEVIKQETQRNSAHTSPGIFTALPRKDWFQIYKNLDPEKLNLIQSALLFVSIDLETWPQDRQQKLWCASYGNAHNRWYDKTHQLIIFADGSAALNRDHTWVDGKSTLNYMSHVWKRTQEIDETPTTQAYPFELINFEKQDTQEVRKYILREQNNRNLICFDIENLGESFWRKHSLSPNGIMQLAIGRAAFLTYGRWLNTSEAVSMGHLEQARYETIWTLTPESKKLIQSPRPLLSQLHEALDTHKKLVKACKHEQGPVFHLTALSALSSLPWLSRLVHCEITTSNPGYQPGCELGCFTDTEKDIIGICYFFQENITKVSIKADGLYRHQIEQLRDLMIESLKLFQKIVSDVT